LRLVLAGRLFASRFGGSAGRFGTGALDSLVVVLLIIVAAALLLLLVVAVSLRADGRLLIGSSVASVHLTVALVAKILIAVVVVVAAALLLIVVLIVVVVVLRTLIVVAVLGRSVVVVFTVAVLVVAASMLLSRAVSIISIVALDANIVGWGRSLLMMAGSLLVASARGLGLLA